MKSEHLQVVAFTLHRLKRKLNSTEFSIIYNLLSNQTERNWFNCNNSKILKVKIISYYLLIHNFSFHFQKIFKKSQISLKKTNKRSFLTAGIYFPPFRIYHTWGEKNLIEEHKHELLWWNTVGSNGCVEIWWVPFCLYAFGCMCICFGNMYKETLEWLGLLKCHKQLLDFTLCVVISRFLILLPKSHLTHESKFGFRSIPFQFQ